VVVKGLGARVGFLAWSLAIACGGSSVRHGDADSDDGVTIPSAGRGGTSSGGSDGTGGVSADPSLCLELERALDVAKECVADADCGQILQDWTCPPGSLTGIEPKPPVVNLDADARNVALLFSEAARAGGCALVTHGCNDCVVDGYGCIVDRCDWRIVDCGPPPN
jgi:hypothetical protein